MKILILSTDAVHHTYFINRLLREGVDIAGVIHETTCAKPPFPTGPFWDEEQAAFERRQFFESLPDRLPEDLPVHTTGTVNEPSVIELATSMGADLGIVFGCGKIRPEVFRVAREGLINIHRGICQHYRGLDADLWPLYFRDFDKIGVTIHRVDERLDTGAILKCRTLPLERSLKIFQLRYWTTVLATDLIVELLQETAQRGLPQGTPQQTAGKYFSFMPLDKKRIAQKHLDEFANGHNK